MSRSSVLTTTGAAIVLMQPPVERFNHSLWSHDIPGAQSRMHPRLRQMIEQESQREKSKSELSSSIHWNGAETSRARNEEYSLRESSVLQNDKPAQTARSYVPSERSLSKFSDPDAGYKGFTAPESIHSRYNMPSLWDYKNEDSLYAGYKKPTKVGYIYKNAIAEGTI